MSDNDSPEGGEILVGFLLGGLVIYGMVSTVKFMLKVTSVPSTDVGTIPATQMTPIPTPETSESDVVASMQAPTSKATSESDYDSTACRYCGGHNFCPCGNCIDCVGGSMNYCSSCD